MRGEEEEAVNSALELMRSLGQVGHLQGKMSRMQLVLKV